MRGITVIDPGHGGSVHVGGSTPYGVRGLNGLLEKNVTLALAQRVAERIGSSLCLTRYGDVNLPLVDRAGLARDLASPVFLSIHANGGAREPGHGSETWIHSGAGAASMALADDVRDALARTGIVDRGLRRGNIASLNPSRHDPGCAACLIEVDHLDHVDGARRLGNPRELDVVADALAHAVDRYLRRPAPAAGRTYTYGRRWSHGLADPLDLTDFPTNVFVVVPDASAPTVPRQIRTTDLNTLQTAWDRMMRGKGITLEGSGDDQRGFRELLRGGLSDSPMIRQLFQEIALDDAHALTMHVGRSQPGVFVDAFRFDPTQGSIAAGVNQAGHHTVDLDDFDQLPRVAGNPRRFIYLKHQVLVHALREARQGTLGDPYPTAHPLAIDDENVFRTEQGQIGVKDHNQPSQIGSDLRWDFTHNGAIAFFETWHTSGSSITSIDYSP
jgi:N-acetylmuramoyl-L-alanine amidase